MSNSLEQLKQHTLVVADTGAFDQMAQFQPRDATTNPSLILKASSDEQYAAMVDEAVAEAVRGGGGVAEAMDLVSVAFGKRILETVPGRVSTEVDARLSFDTEATLAAARRIMGLYTAAGIDAKERVLIKISSTWEGLQACRQLEAEGIHCNMTLLFCTAQAAVAGEVGATLISPFAGRITDYFKKERGVSGFAAEEDPGVLSVRAIHTYMKKFGYATEVMGASFRNKEQIIALAGCDLLTISPQLLGELAAADIPVPCRLDAAAAADADVARIPTDEVSFRLALNGDMMATFKLAEGINSFIADTEKLEAIVAKKIAALQ